MEDEWPSTITRIGRLDEIALNHFTAPSTVKDQIISDANCLCGGLFLVVQGSLDGGHSIVGAIHRTNEFSGDGGLLGGIERFVSPRAFPSG